MGKTFSMIFKVLYGIDKKGFSSAMISKRLQDSKKGGSIFRDNEILLGAFAGCESSTSDYPTFYWPHWLSAHRLTHSSFNTNNPAERAAFIEMAKKNQNGLQQFDEADAMEEFEYNYWQSRNRDDSGMEPQSTYSFNPPGPDHYLTRNLVNAGYIGEDWYFKPEMNGATRYFYMVGNTFADAVWGNTPEEVAAAANIQISDGDKAAGVTIYHIVKSFTAFTGEASDNRKLIAATHGQVIGNLHAVGKTQRSILKGAYFGPTDNEELTVSRQMIHALFDNPVDGDSSMYATMDISSGEAGNDRMPMLIWRGLRLVAAEVFSGGKMELSGWIDTRLKKYGVPIQNFAFDATGHGYWVQGFSSGVPVTWNARVVQEYDEHGNAVTLDEYFNLRSQLLGKTKVLIERGDMSIALDKDMLLPFGRKGTMRKLIDILFDEMNVFVTTKKNKKTYYRSKDEYKAKFKASPDFMECISLRAYFELDARRKKEAAAPITDDAYNGLYRRYGVRGGVRGIGTRVSV